MQFPRLECLGFLGGGGAIRGRLEIHSSVYNHNFIVLDHQPPGPDFTLTVPFQISTTRPPVNGLAEVRGNQVVFLRALSCQDEVALPIQGFSDGAKDAEIVVENEKVGAGLRIGGNRSLLRDLVWSIRRVLAIEPYVSIDIQPGGEFTWNDTLDYYTLPAS